MAAGLAAFAYAVLCRCSGLRVPAPRAALLIGSEVSWLRRGTTWHNGVDVFRVLYCLQCTWCFRPKFQLLESKTAGSGDRDTQRPVD